jgi:uncharacterized membrane protein YeiH
MYSSARFLPRPSAVGDTLAAWWRRSALAGASVVVTGDLLYLPPVATTIGGAALCFMIRLAAIRRGWSLPTADVVQRRP